MAKDKAKKDKDADDDGEKSNLVPAIIIGVAAVLGAKFAAGGASTPAATGAPSATTVAAEGSGTTGHEGGAATSVAAPAGETTAPPVTEAAHDTTHDTTHDTAHDSTPSSVAGSSAPTTVESAHGDAPSSSTHSIAWSYTGATGPTRWGSLDSSFATCGTGEHQSPIDLASPMKVGLTDLAFYYTSTAGTVVNNGHTLATTFAPGSGVVIDGVRYDLTSMHAHTPSEHAIDGTAFPMEIHLVHTDANGDLAVVALLVQEGAENPALDPIWSVASDQVDTPVASAGPVELARLLPDDRSAYRYTGSLTTPPCTEGVSWNVIQTPITASAEQIAAFSKLFGSNNRPLQKPNGRTVLQDSGPDAR